MSKVASRKWTHRHLHQHSSAMQELSPRVAKGKLMELACFLPPMHPPPLHHPRRRHRKVLALSALALMRLPAARRYIIRAPMDARAFTPSHFELSTLTFYVPFSSHYQLIFADCLRAKNFYFYSDALTTNLSDSCLLHICT